MHARVVHLPAFSAVARSDRFFSKWYYSAVWNYFGIETKQRNPAAIGAHILPPITPIQAEEAIGLLLELGLIRKTASGYTVAEKHIYTEKNVQAMAARQHIRELTGMAMQVFESLPAEQRQYNALMFSVSRNGLPDLDFCPCSERART